MKMPDSRGFALEDGMAARREQVSVILDPDLRAFAEQVAAREDRSVAGQIRHRVAEAARREAPDRNRQRRSSKSVAAVG
jgi:hypothetical protein